MRTIILFLIYAAACLFAILNLESIYAIIVITAVTILFMYLIIKGTHPNNRYIKYYKILIIHMDEYYEEGFTIYLCNIVQTKNYPQWFQNDLKRRLSDIDDTYPLFRDKDRLLPSRYTSKEIIDHRLGMWEGRDYSSRYTFINRIIQDLRKERYKDRHL